MTRVAAAASVAFHRPPAGDEAEAGRSCVGLELSRLKSRATKGTITSMPTPICSSATNDAGLAPFPSCPHGKAGQPASTTAPGISRARHTSRYS